MAAGMDISSLSNNMSDMVSSAENIALETKTSDLDENNLFQDCENFIKSESCQETTDPESVEPTVAESADKVVSEDKKEDEWMDILGSGQLRKKIIQRAENGFRPHRSMIVTINVEGKLEDGTVIDKENNLTLQLGDAEHIQAMDLTLPMMDVGETALLEVGPRFAYGASGRVSDVPPNATITYRIELLAAEDEPDIGTLPAAKRKEIGCRKRERGNYWYSRQEHTLAIQCYRRALNFLDDIERGVNLPNGGGDESIKDTNEELQELLEERLKVYNNLAAAQMKIEAYDAAMMSAESVLRCQPNNVKALYRKGKILSEKGNNSQAVAVLRQAQRLEPGNPLIRQELLRILSLHREDTQQERNLYKKMLGQDKPLDDTSSSEDNRGVSKSLMSAQFQLPWTTILFGTLAALVAGVVAYRYKFL